MSDIKVILPQVLLVHILVTRLFPGLFGNSVYFHDITNYELEPLAMLAIHGDTIKEIYV